MRCSRSRVLVVLATALVGLSAASVRTAGASTYHSATLSGISCPTASLCFAVGSQTVVSGRSETLIEQGRDGTWQNVWSPDARATNSLEAIACAGPRFCVAVGATGPSGSGSEQPLGAIWTGGSWRRSAVVTVPGAFQADLDSVACPAVGRCVAVGSGGLDGVVEQLVAGEWSLVPTEPVPAAVNSWRSVSCAAVGRCTALDDWTSGQVAVGVQTMVLAHGTFGPTGPEVTGDGSWREQAITCRGLPSCLSVGFVGDPSGGYVPSAQLLDGRRWTSIPVAHGAISSWLRAARCLSPASCVAVGASDLVGGRSRAMAEYFGGTRFVLDKTPASGDRSGLDAVACPTKARCVAVGFEGRRALVETATSPAGPWRIAET